MTLQQRSDRCLERRNVWPDSERRSAQYFHHLIDISPDPFFTIDAEGKIVDTNSAAVIMTGMTSMALVGSVFADYFTNPVEAHKKCQQVLLQGFLNDPWKSGTHREEHTMFFAMHEWFGMKPVSRSAYWSLRMM